MIAALTTGNNLFPHDVADLNYALSLFHRHPVIACGYVLWSSTVPLFRFDQKETP